MPSNEPRVPPTLRAAEFPITAEYTYLNTATQGPIPDRTRRAIEHAAQQAQFPGITGAQVDPAEALARARLAQLLHVGADDLVFTANTTYGLNICAHGIDWRAGDNVVIPDHEFPSLMHTWLHLRTFGVEVRLVAYQGAGPSAAELMAATDARTRVVSCSAVAWDTGYRIDLAELGRCCAAAGILLVVDGIQAVGAVDLDPQALRISALATHGYKWLMGGFGVGALYVAPAAVDRIQPRFVGEQSYAGSGDPADPAAPWKPGARRYSLGSGNGPGYSALASSLELIAEVGIAAIAAHNHELSSLLIAGLRRLAPAVQLITPGDPAQHAAIVVFTLGDPLRDEAVAVQLAAQGIVVALRRRGIRVSPHLYNTPAEIEALLRALPAAVSAITR
ncbi:MAG TPA: aminotransferase class V-fold PLP-dependent enzyme [Roseiflexaceae bacterium]|nr:aminotransferase class V-fold PLP-dependent enzyme [Roseiflexaceae bacterium]HMP40589.1 aminotransferase class V-fold PLP-dependent enzyme [Roseiflexaceae bacterium]